MRFLNKLLDYLAGQNARHVCAPGSQQGFIMLAGAIVGGVLAISKRMSDVSRAKQQTASLNQQNQLQATEISDQKSLEIQQTNDAQRRQRALVNVAAGDSGLNVGSPSVEAQLMDSLFQADRSNALTVKSNDILQRSRQMQALSAFNQMQPAPGWLAALQIGGSALQGYTSMGGTFGGGPQSPFTPGGLLRTDIQLPSIQPKTLTPIQY